MGVGSPHCRRGVCNQKNTMVVRPCRVCGLGGVNFELFGAFSLLWRVPVGIAVYLVRVYDVVGSF